MTVHQQELPGDDAPRVVMRPAGQINDFPVDIRWEVTRRHPYYLIFWQSALDYLKGNPDADEADQLMQRIAYMMLGAIGVTGPPVDPTTDFKDLDEESLDSAFLSGAVQPISLRAIATSLLNILPPEELVVLGSIFRTAGEKEYAVENDDERLTAQRMNASIRLASLSSTPLDSYCEIPLFYIHLGASQRTIVEDIRAQVQRRKKQKGIPEKRLHTSKLKSYLEVWDLREGWIGKGYDPLKQKTFKQIAKKLKVDLSTVADRYRVAFHMITGHEFSPNLWNQLLFHLKFNPIFQGNEEALSAPMRHHLESPTKRDVPEAVVSPKSDAEESTGFIENRTTVASNETTVDLRMDLQEMFDQGLSNEDIAQRLNCEAKDVGYLRDRFDEFKEM